MTELEAILIGFTGGVLGAMTVIVFCGVTP